MRKILILVLVLVSLQSFGQTPPNYTNIFGRYRWIAGMFDSSFHLPRYNGVPSGLRVGSSPNDGALAADTLNGHIYRYHNTTWGRLALYADIAAASQRFGVTGEDRIAAQERTFSGLNHTYSFRFDSLNTWDVARNGIQRMYVNSTATGAYTPNGLNGVQLFNDSIQIKQISGNYSIYNLPQRFDTSANKVLTWDASTLKLGWSSYFGGGGGGSGTVNTGAALKAAYYPSAAALVDDWVGVEFGNTNLNTKITAQATTEVPLEIKLASSQTANALNISSSAGTGDLANFDANGRLTVEAGTNADGGITFGSGAGFYKTSVGGIGWNTTGGGGYGALGSGSFELYPSGAGNSMSRGGGHVGAAVTAEFTMSPGGTSWLYQLGTTATTAVDQTFRAQNTTGADKSGSNLIIQSGNGTGNGNTNSAIKFQTPDAGASSSTAQTYTDKFIINKLGQLRANLYGVGTFTGTPARYLAVEADGDVIEATASSLKPSLNKGIFIQAPTSADIVDVWQTPVAITVTSLKAILRGTTPSVTYNVRFGTDITSATTVFTSDITCTSITTGCSNSSGFNDATIPAGSFIWVFTTAASGTINSISFTINYTED